MSLDDPKAAERRDRLVEVLLRHDDLVAAGATTPDLDEYVRLYPDLAEGLRDYFEHEQDVARKAGSLRALGGAGQGGPLPLRSFGKYEVLHREGDGGMGVVVRAFDLVVKREVVLKVIKKREGETVVDPERLRRFRLEGQLLGQLEHPGIVPLHEMGETDHGEPYLAMKLVRGRTLDRLLSGRMSVVDQREQFLDDFVKVCDAVSYAHGKRVLHRDLKPSNVMVGEHEEVQLTDFGLAKVLAPKRAEPAGAPIPPRVATENEKSFAGSTPGSPGYMAPEQARGDGDAQDERSDVFGLGGILCVILTLHPPRMSQDVALLMRDPSDPGGASLAGAHVRVSSCGGPAALAALCRSCLAFQPADRPPSAKAVADAVRAYREGLVQDARQNELKAVRAAAEAKDALKKRRLAYGLLAAVILLVAAGGLAWYLNGLWKASAAEVARVQKETAESVHRLVAASKASRTSARAAPLDDVDRLFRQAVDEARQADEEAQRAPADEAVRKEARQALDEAEADAAAAAKDRILLTQLLEALAFRETTSTDTEDIFARPFRDWGLDPDHVPAAEAAKALRSRPKAVATEMVSALDQWAYERRLRDREAAKRLFDVADAADQADDRRRELRRLLAGSIPFHGPEALDGERVKALAQKVDPAQDSPLTLGLLARALWEIQEVDTMESVLRAAVRARPQDALPRAYLGVMYLMRGVNESYGVGLDGSPQSARTGPVNKPAAARDFEEAVVCFEALRALRPETSLLLAAALLQTPRAAEGLDMIRERRRQRPDDPLPALLERFALMLKGDLPGAANIPQPGADDRLAQLGRLMEAATAIEKKDWDRVERLCREVLRTTTDPTLACLAYERLGAALYYGKHQKAEAIQAFAESSRLSQGLPSGHAYLSQKSMLTNNVQEAETLLRMGLQEDPTNACLVTYTALFLRKYGKPGDSEEVRRMLPRTQMPTDAYSLYRLGGNLIALGEFSMAETALHQGLPLDADPAAATPAAAIVVLGETQFQEAETCGRAVVANRPDYYLGYYLLGWSLHQRRRFEEAETPLRQAVERKPDAADCLLVLGDTLRRLKKFNEAETFLRKGLDLDPKNHPEAYTWLGDVLHQQGDEKAAAEMLQKAEELQRQQHP